MIIALAVSLNILTDHAAVPIMQAEAAACAPLSGEITTGTSEHTLTAGGIDRSYRVYIPPGYASSQPTALVLALHGFAQGAELLQAEATWDAVADEHEIIVAYPQGTGFPVRWHSDGGFDEDGGDDVAFLRTLITTLIADYCIDPARVYINGFSNGGGMAHRMACEAADVVAAIGGVAGAYSTPTECTPSRPVPVIAFHGDADMVVDYTGADDQFDLPAIPDWAAGWAARNDCDLEAESLPVQGAVSGIRYTDCADDADVVLYTIAGGGHTWPGGPGEVPAFIVGATTQDIDASAAMWEFFQRHTLPGDLLTEE
ncbi:MAG: poly(3-hydroxybutyrate) depolymerase [Chloroflexi bacterium]|nr:poly(3-hydroxybutyrate) depolymerase [Chloroflexota bacterium]